VSELYNLSEQVATLVCDTLLAVAGTDRVGWDITFQLMPGQQGPQPIIVVFLQLPSPVLGQFLNHMIFVDVNDLNPVAISSTVKEAVEVLRVRRSELLSAPGQLSGGLAAQRAAALGQQNGRP
jgi:hypothetical protein